MKGHLHPITLTIQQIIKILRQRGFVVKETPEIETEKHNFDFLNVPEDHPSRDEHDTFWLDNKKLLRTHTTAGYAGLMVNQKPPVRFLVPGRCFRNEATDESHESTFYQIDGFVIDKNITMANLLGTLEYLLEEFFNKNIDVKFTPAYFPFVEPGLEAKIKIENPAEWLEVLGAGMLHPKVIINMGLDSQEWQGFAFGIGIDRLMMIKYGINDIRLSYQSDWRFLKQF